MDSIFIWIGNPYLLFPMFLKNKRPDSKAHLTKIRPLGVHCCFLFENLFWTDECHHPSPSLHNLGIPKSIYQVCSGTESVCPFLCQRPVFPTLKFSFHRICFAPLKYIPEKNIFISKIAAQTRRLILYIHIYMYMYMYIYKNINI